MAEHLSDLTPHLAHGRRGWFNKMGNRFRKAALRHLTFLWQRSGICYSSGDYAPARFGTRVPEAEGRVWKPPWLQRRRRLANFITWLTSNTLCIWYFYYLVSWLHSSIAHVSACGSVVCFHFGPRLESLKGELEVQSLNCVQSLGYWFVWSLLCFRAHNLVRHPAMAPRQRGIPRRGSNYGGRGGNRGRGEPVPPCIVPLASKSPSSSSSEHSGPSLHSSLHSCQFKFKSKLHKPTISDLLTVIFSEEEEDSSSSDDYIRDSPHSHSPSNSHENEAGDILNAPDPLRNEAQHEDSPLHSISANEDIIPCAPTSSSGNRLHMMSLPERAEQVPEEKMGVEWVSSTGCDMDADEDMPPQALAVSE